MSVPKKLWLKGIPLSVEDNEAVRKFQKVMRADCERQALYGSIEAPALELTDAEERQRAVRLRGDWERYKATCGVGPFPDPEPPAGPSIAKMMEDPDHCDCGGPAGHVPNGIYCRSKP